MSGASGPIVTVQIPSAPFVIGCGLPSSSPLTVTWDAFGARYRSVRDRSAPISGETTEGPRPPRPPAAGGLAGGCAHAADAISVIATPSRAVRRTIMTSTVSTDTTGNQSAFPRRLASAGQATSDCRGSPLVQFRHEAGVVELFLASVILNRKRGSRRGALAASTVEGRPVARPVQNCRA